MAVKKPKLSAAEAAEERQWKREQAARDKKSRQEHDAKVKDILAFTKKNPIHYTGKDGLIKTLTLTAADFTLHWMTKRKTVDVDYMKGEDTRFTLYYVPEDDFGWVVTTLGIQGQRRHGMVERSYGARTLDGKLVRVGNGPHVERTLEIIRYADRAKALEPLTELYKKGSVDAHVRRDELSTSRAQSRNRRRFW